MDHINALIEQNRSLKSTHTAYLDSLGQPRRGGLKKEYVSPQMRSLPELITTVKGKNLNRWQGSKLTASEFSEPGVLRGQILDSWEKQKILEPDRNFKSKTGRRVPIRNDLVPKEFGTPSTNLLTRRYKEVLKKHMDQYLDYQLHPSRYVKPPIVPNCTHPRGFKSSGGIAETYMPTQEKKYLRFL